MDMNDRERLAAQLRFVGEIDKLKGIFRQSWLRDGSRHENDAEHSWHLAVMAVVLREYVAEVELDLGRTIEMLLVHDLVEIDAGDTFAYDAEAAVDKAQREQAAADRIFAILPADQAEAFRSLWDEFEARATPEARYAAALDCLQPLLHNYHTRGRAWQEHGVRACQVIARNRHIGETAPRLWEYAESLIRESVEMGYLVE